MWGVKEISVDFQSLKTVSDSVNITCGGGGGRPTATGNDKAGLITSVFCFKISLYIL